MMRKFSQTVAYIDEHNIVHVRSARGRRYPVNSIKYNGNINDINIGDTAIVEQRTTNVQPFVHYLLVDVIRKNNIPEITGVVEL